MDVSLLLFTLITAAWKLSAARVHNMCRNDGSRHASVPLFGPSAAHRAVPPWHAARAVRLRRNCHSVAHNGKKRCEASSIFLATQQ
jgi:hypothetical protein